MISSSGSPRPCSSQYSSTPFTSVVLMRSSPLSDDGRSWQTRRSLHSSAESRTRRPASTRSGRARYALRSPVASSARPFDNEVPSRRDSNEKPSPSPARTRVPEDSGRSDPRATTRMARLLYSGPRARETLMSARATAVCLAVALFIGTAAPSLAQHSGGHGGGGGGFHG